MNYLNLTLRVVNLKTLAWLLIGAVAGTAYSVATTSPAVTLLSIQEQEQVVVNNGWVDLSVHVLVQTICSTKTDRNLWRIETHGGKPVRVNIPFPALSIAILPLGDNSFTFRLPLPVGVEPGKWNYVSRSTPDCGILRWLISGSTKQSMDIPIVVPPAS